MTLQSHCEVYIQRKTRPEIHAPNVHCSTVYSDQGVETIHMSIDEQMDKDVARVYNGIFLSH